jgi:hypothetical protein
VDRQVVAVEHRVVAGAQDAAASHRNERRAADGDDVEALVDPSAAAWSSEFADSATDAVRTLDREDVVVVEQATVIASGASDCRNGKSCE